MTDRIVLRTAAVRFIRVAGLMVFVGYLLLVVVPVSGVALASFAVIGIGTAGMVPLAWSAVNRKQPDAPGSAIAAVAACGYLGFLTGPVLLGGLAEAAGLHLAVTSVAVLTVPIVLLAAGLRVPSRTDTSSHQAVRSSAR